MTDTEDQATWEVYAVKYAEADGLPPAKVEVGADPHRSPHDLTYYVWLIRRPGEDIVVDSGFNAASGAKADTACCGLRWTGCVRSASTRTPSAR